MNIEGVKVWYVRARRDVAQALYTVYMSLAQHNAVKYKLYRVCFMSTLA